MLSKELTEQNKQLVTRYEGLKNGQISRFKFNRTVRAEVKKVEHSQKKTFKGNKLSKIHAKVDNQLNYIDIKEQRKKEREQKRNKQRKCYTL